MVDSGLTSFNNIGVIVGRDLIGDALIKLPVVRALRAACPLAKIHWITSQGPTAFGGQLRSVTSHIIDEIHEQPSWLPSLNNLSPVGAAPHFDLLIDTRNRWKEELLARKGLSYGIFISQSLRYLLSDKRPSLFRRRPKHMIDRMLLMVELGTGCVPSVSGGLAVRAEAIAQAKQILPDGLTYIGFAPGAGNRIKVWPLDRFIKLASIQFTQGRVPVFLLGPDEIDWQEEIAAAVPAAKFPLQDYEVWGGAGISIEQTLAVGTLLKLAVSNDSGTGHMLAAVDCPLISLFGPTSPAKLAPKNINSHVIHAHDFGGTEMDRIPLEYVNDMVNKVISLQKPH